MQTTRGERQKAETWFSTAVKSKGRGEKAVKVEPTPLTKESIGIDTHAK